MKEKKREIWIDLSKCIAIILMMLGHYEAYGSGLRNFIFSFHMPLFYILSGYTLKIPEDMGSLYKKTLKDIKRFIIPAILVSAIAQILLMYLNKENYSDFFAIELERILWGNGCDYFGIKGFGVLWFLNSLIISKFIYSYIEIKRKEKNNFPIYFILMIMGIYIGKRIWLIQNIDISLVALIFLYAGFTLKKNKHYLEEYAKIYNLFLLLALLIWKINLANVWYIELATRMYPSGFTICIVAIFACLIIFKLCNYIEELLPENIIKILADIGKNSIYILFIHHIEYATGIFDRVGLHNKLIKIILNILIAYIVIYTINLARSKKRL